MFSLAIARLTAVSSVSRRRSRPQSESGGQEGFAPRHSKCRKSDVPTILLIQAFAGFYCLDGPLVGVEFKRFENSLSRILLPAKVQELLLLVGGLVRAILPELYRLWEGLVDFKGTARSVLPDSTAASSVEVWVIHSLSYVLIPLEVKLIC